MIIETVSVEEAILKGKKMINYPALAIMIAIIIVSIAGAVALEEETPILVIVGFGLSFVVAWLYWSIFITKWRIWAFENVRNVHELKKRAIQENLIWKDGSIFEKTEIRTQAQQAKLDELALKFNREDVFTEDYSVPSETAICFSKTKSKIELAVMVFVLFFAIYLISDGEKMILGIFSLGISLYSIYNNYKKLSNSEPQITLSNEGISLVSGEFYAWDDIQNEEAFVKNRGKYAKHYLTFLANNEEIKLEIADFDTNVSTLNKLLIVYRGRFNAKRK
jgi:hypothetical protein